MESVRQASEDTDADVLNSIATVLAVDVPAEGDNAVVISRCHQSREALLAFGEYLVPKHGCAPQIVTTFPGSSPKETWSLIWKWAKGLEYWTTPLGGMKCRPSQMWLSDEWYEPALLSILKVASILVEFHSDCALAKELSQSDGFVKFLVRSIFCTMKLDLTWEKLGSILIHRSFRDRIFKGQLVLAEVAAMTRDHKEANLARLALQDLTHQMQKGTQSLGGSVAVLVVLDAFLCQGGHHELLGDLARWCTEYTVLLLEKGRRIGIQVTWGMDMKAVGHILISVLRILVRIFRREGSTGPLYESLRAGLLTAIANVGFFLDREQRTTIPPREHASPMVLRLCGKLLDTIVPHFLCIPVLRLIQKATRKGLSIHDAMQPKWGLWLNLVSKIVQIYFRYKTTPSSWALARTCGNEKCTTIPSRDSRKAGRRFIITI
ncbi:hypothetical protein VNI00_016471 [Paramarasmius palmivorus]|uniref:Uncharacterized protein n=1 Tax=Paramarasmius palmivorus TaxID=297713 RepID=A0AAW0BE65_9AGAR